MVKKKSEEYKLKLIKFNNKFNDLVVLSAKVLHKPVTQYIKDVVEKDIERLFPDEYKTYLYERKLSFIEESISNNHIDEQDWVSAHIKDKKDSE